MTTLSVADYLKIDSPPNNERDLNLLHVLGPLEIIAVLIVKKHHVVQFRNQLIVLYYRP